MEESAEETKNPRGSHRWCSVPFCKARNVRSMHKFPHDPHLKSKWALACKIGKEVSVNMNVCSEHFLKSDYIPRWDGQAKRLKKIAIPSQNLPKRPSDQNSIATEIKKKEDRIVKAKKRLKCSDVESEVITTNNGTEDTSDEASLDINNDHYSLIVQTESQQKVSKNIRSFISATENYCTCEDDDQSEVAPEKYESCETKAARVLLEVHEIVDELMKNEDIMYVTRELILKRVDEFYSLARRLQKILFPILIKTDQQLHAFTGIDFQLLNNLTKAVIVFEDDNYKKFDINVEGRIILCLMKIRLNLSFRCLANLFQLNEENCKLLFCDTLQSLKTILKSAIYWPTKDEILNFMPECFENFKTTVAVADKTEIVVEKRTCPKCKLSQSSPYRNGDKVKILHGFAKCGLITYISKAQCGNSSQEINYNKDSIAKVLLLSRDAIMTDGVFIEQKCNKVFIDLIQARQQRPFCPLDPVFKDKPKPFKNHIEQAIVRIKMFKILGSKVSADIVPFIDDISIIVCGIVNLYNPVVVNKLF